MSIRILRPSIHLDDKPYSVKALCQADNGEEFQVVVTEDVITEKTGWPDWKPPELVEFVQQNIPLVEAYVRAYANDYAIRNLPNGDKRGPLPSGSVIIVHSLNGARFGARTYRPHNGGP